jgi:hypothetical protein
MEQCHLTQLENAGLPPYESHLAFSLTQIIIGLVGSVFPHRWHSWLQYTWATVLWQKGSTPETIRPIRNRQFAWKPSSPQHGIDILSPFASVWRRPLDAVMPEIA